MTNRTQRVLDRLAEAVGVMLRVIGYGLQMAVELMYFWW